MAYVADVASIALDCRVIYLFNEKLIGSIGKIVSSLSFQSINVEFVIYATVKHCRVAER